ncbi:MAG: hypothetical protein ACR2GO_08615 [Candidatus Limnocylindria bacterium]
MNRFRSLLLLPVVLAACGGGAPGATSSEPTIAPATQGGGATGAAVDWCLNSPPEVEAAIHVMGVVATSTDAAGIGACTYTLADGALVHAISVVQSQGFEATFEAGKQTAGVVEISGIGKAALLMSPGGPLVILTDTGLISMGPLGPADLMSDAAAYRTAVESLGRSAVERMP